MMVDQIIVNSWESQVYCTCAKITTIAALSKITTIAAYTVTKLNAFVVNFAYISSWYLLIKQILNMWIYWYLAAHLYMHLFHCSHKSREYGSWTPVHVYGSYTFNWKKAKSRHKITNSVKIEAICYKFNK